jgi:hypothetical protein
LYWSSYGLCIEQHSKLNWFLVLFQKREFWILSYQNNY